MVLTRSQSNARASANLPPDLMTTLHFAPAKRKKRFDKVDRRQKRRHDKTSTVDSPTKEPSISTFKIPRIELTNDLSNTKIALPPPPPPAPTPVFASADQLAKTPNGRNTLDNPIEPSFTAPFFSAEGGYADITAREMNSDNRKHGPGQDLPTAVMDAALESLKEPEPAPEERPLPEVATVLSESLPLQDSFMDPVPLGTISFLTEIFPPAVTLSTTTVEPAAGLTTAGLTTTTTAADTSTVLPVVPMAPAASTIPAPAPAPVSAELTDSGSSPPVILATAEDSSVHSLEEGEPSVTSTSGQSQGTTALTPSTRVSAVNEVVNIATPVPLLLAVGKEN
ncbi:hypothetical protein BGW38_005253 [Lunasporangiospora selenospora]|uniref:Uncharacterized protein n=1 Tax=Lunasporangiospora selenospora TaxID=979761 RepID=A0A9P6KBH0_9FUNG|nr:hypothetical protein BGW38_005253 [Lunasporangiospora selenospora]